MSPRRGENLVVPKASFDSYYGRPILAEPVWEAREIAGYFFLGGLAGGSSLLSAGAQLSGRPTLARAGRLAAAGAISLSLAALVKDLGKPARFLNMLRTVKPTSPMSVGTWIVSAYAPLAGAAAASELTGLLPGLGTVAGLGAAGLAPAVASYTAVLAADTAVPAWHDGYRELPFVFASSAAVAAGGFGMLAAPRDQAGPARRLAAVGAAVELVASHRMEARLGIVAETYTTGRAGCAAPRRSSPQPARPPACCSAAGPEPLPRSAVPPYWPARPAPGSPSSRPAALAPATRSTSSNPSAGDGATDPRRCGDETPPSPC